MKKLMVCLAVLLLALSVVSCTTQTVLPDVSSSPAESTEASVSAEGISSEEDSALASTPEEESSQEISEEIAPKDLLYLNNAGILFQKHGVYAVESYEIRDYSVRYYIATEDGLQEFHRESDFVDGNMDVYFDLYPDSRRVILNNHTWEKPSDVYLYEAATGEKRQLDMSGLPRNELVTAMRWLDGRYFLFVSQFDHGTIAIGGDVWVYDTETDEYFRIIAREDGYMQISYITVYDGMVLFYVPYYIDDAYSDTEMHYYTLSTKEIYQLIDTRNEITFRVGEWLY